MREGGTAGRFDYRFELDNIEEGIKWDLETNWGTAVVWYPWDSTDTNEDPVYSVAGNPGRVWKPSLILPIVSASLTQGTSPHYTHEGFYNVDTLMLSVRVDALEHIGLGYITRDTDPLLKDRVLFRNQIFTPVVVSMTGMVGPNRYTMVEINCDQVNSDELVDDVTFQQYAN